MKGIASYANLSQHSAEFTLLLLLDAKLKPMMHG